MRRAYLAGEPSPVMGDNPELAFWCGVELANEGKVDEARAALEVAFAVGDHWRELLVRLPRSGFLSDDPELLRRLTT